MLVLGIESSCDETAAAVVRDGVEIVSSVVATQVDVHKLYGGVVPEIASRKHIEAISAVVTAALTKAGVTLDDIDGLAVTQGPGLAGALLVGFCFAKSLAFAKKLPIVGVNHLTAHLNAIFLADKNPAFPFVALLASGGHTAIYHVTDYTQCRLLGQTRDDAAGEAFDKVAKMLNLGYPGGVVIDRLAKDGDPSAIKFPRIYLKKDEFDFSFSGLKSAVMRYVQDQQVLGVTPDVNDLAAGFQDAVVDVLVKKLLNAAKVMACPRIVTGGGVAANSRLRKVLAAKAARQKLELYMPPVSLCGDNAAMVASAGYRQLLTGENLLDLHSDVYARVKTRGQRPLDS